MSFVLPSVWHVAPVIGDVVLAPASAAGTRWAAMWALRRLHAVRKRTTCHPHVKPAASHAAPKTDTALHQEFAATLVSLHCDFFW